MNAIYLPGNSPKNKEWIDAIEEATRDIFETTVVQHYEHWESGDDWLDIQQEKAHLAATLRTWHGNDYVVVAKSIGVPLVLQTLSDEQDATCAPTQFIFIGTPLRVIENVGYSFDTVLERFQTPTLFIQNTRDPAAHSGELDRYLNESAFKRYHVTELSANDHIYTDIGRINDEIRAFVPSS